MTKATKIAVLGGGNGAHAMAADLTLKGYEVNICEAPEFKEAFSTTLERQAIDLIDVWGEKHTVKLNMATTNFAQALKGVNYIMMAVPAIGAKSFFSSIVPYLEEGQTIIKWSGNFSALLFANILKEKGVNQIQPAVRFELTTGGLRNRCSTPELRWHLKLNLRKLATNWRRNFYLPLRAALRPVVP